MRTNKLRAILLRESKVPLTPGRAAEYLGLPAFEGERGLDRRNLDKLEREMRQGRFNWSNVVIATCDVGGTVYKVNGQHTCEARRRAGKEVADGVVTMQVYAADSMADLKALYSSFDVGKARSRAHLLTVELTGSEIVGELGIDLCRRVSNGISFWLGKEWSPAEIMGALGEFGDHVRAVGSVLRESESDGRLRLNRAPVIAAMLETWSAASSRPARYADFWLPIATGVALERGSPQKLLHKWLWDNALMARGVGRVKRVVSGEVMYRTCVSAWNKFARGESNISRLVAESAEGRRKAVVSL